ncbi:MAG: fluoride efflux transporter CrcB [Dehalococcoidia bacterium]
MRLLLALAGGALGSGLRYLGSQGMAARLGLTFPWGTLAVNLAGSFLIGLIATLADERGAVGWRLRLFLITGVLGGFTTFSAFSLETLRLVGQGQPLRAGLYVAGSVALGLLAAAAGIALGRALA